MVDAADLRSTIAGYKIHRTLGKGGNAVVKLVEKDNHKYAMKIFEPHKDDVADFVAETKREYDLVRSLNLESVSKYYEFIEDVTWYKSRNGVSKPHCYCLVMEIIEGVELIDFVNQTKRQDEKYLRYIFTEVMTAMHKMHAAGIAHRDIKPENIMLTNDFKIKMIDLGYGTKLAGRAQNGFNNTKLGTEGYMAPEIVLE